MKKKTTLFLLLFFPLLLAAQEGGRGVYDFLNLTGSARVAALGGKNISLYGNDLNFAQNNPALLNSSMNKTVVMNYTGYFAGIKYGNVAYAQDFKKYGTFSIAANFMNYGKFIAADETGLITGEFKAAEQSISFTWAKNIKENFSAGLAIKPIFSHLETYKSFGFATDIGVSYHKPESEFTAAFAIKNLGTQIKPYYEGHYEPLPYDIQLGVTKKLAHAPFRVNLTAHHLYTWNLLYEKPKLVSNTIFGEAEDPQKNRKLQNFLDNSMRHFVVAVEFVPIKAFHFGIAYDHQRRQEMKLIDKGGFTGFSWGFGLRLRKFNISYARSSFHVVGGSNHLSLGINLGNFIKVSQPKVGD